jgi:hypothetical protein
LLITCLSFGDLPSGFELTVNCYRARCNLPLVVCSAAIFVRASFFYTCSIRGAEVLIGANNSGPIFYGRDFSGNEDAPLRLFWERVIALEQI